MAKAKDRTQSFQKLVGSTKKKTHTHTHTQNRERHSKDNQHRLKYRHTLSSNPLTRNTLYPNTSRIISLLQHDCIFSITIGPQGSSSWTVSFIDRRRTKKVSKHHPYGSIHDPGRSFIEKENTTTTTSCCESSNCVWCGEKGVGVGGETLVSSASTPTWCNGCPDHCGQLNWK